MVECIVDVIGGVCSGCNWWICVVDIIMVECIVDVIGGVCSGCNG